MVALFSLGFIYGPQYWQLVNNSDLFIFACEVGGVHPCVDRSHGRAEACALSGYP